MKASKTEDNCGPQDDKSDASDRQLKPRQSWTALRVSVATVAGTGDILTLRISRQTAQTLFGGIRRQLGLLPPHQYEMIRQFYFLEAYLPSRYSGLLMMTPEARRQAADHLRERLESTGVTDLGGGIIGDVVHRVLDGDLEILDLRLDSAD